MRLTLAWLSVCLAIYCSGHGHGHSHSHSHSQVQGNVVLSLPPSLIATATEAAALRQQQQQPLRWKKDARVLFDSGNDALRDMLQSLPHNQHHDNVDLDVEQQPQVADFNRKALHEADDLVGAQEIAGAQQRGSHYGGATPSHKYGASRCQGRLGPSAKCPQEYYRAMMAARNKEAMARLHMQHNSMQDSSDSYNEQRLLDSDEEEQDEEQTNSNEVFMLLTGEQDLIKFLHWAMQLLYPYERPEGNRSESAAEHYHPGMFLWKKLNLSGHLEPPLIVDEPQFVLVRREKLLDGYHLDDMTKEDDPFIPPRGRKHNSPDLNALLNRYETFVPNRGRRDKVKDLFKYDDLFFPNRGKKQRNIFHLDDPFYPNRGKKLKLRDLYNINDPFFPNRGKRHLTKAPGPGIDQWGKLLPDDSESDSDSDNWPQGMSTHKMNGYDPSVRPSMSVVDPTAAAAEGARWRRLAGGLLQPANRLHSTRSMSASGQQAMAMGVQQLLPQGNPYMPRQQQVKPAVWQQRLKRSLRLADAPETQLTRAPNANPTKIDTETDSDTDTDAAWAWDTEAANWRI
ncbi:uncharacterized protein LOC117583803 [Drosophila guanche]|uniref:Natalisin n=1 Tax=Drosophila guanche TaxID=7266 RepID=A0A3B0JD19_DROGU|nr:uncharacterized protein LOC117583803 [Drosophila guanche]SPP80274.1 Hypothetical predicted protein [Drosophila guanche]